MHVRSFLLLACLAALRLLPAAEPEFPLTEDSKPHPEVLKGELIKESYVAGSNDQAKPSVFPGTERQYQVYIPNGLDRSKPAAFMVFQDGVIYQAPVVFDNLIGRREIPPLIGIFISPGVVPAANENALPRYNRSYEYDSVTDTYSRFLLEELLPAIEKKHQIKLSTDPNDAAISGNSSGGIAAFMVAWHRPDRFRRVFTGVGTYVGIHGADQLPVLVRKMEPKPLRVFLQSGTGDNNLYCGDWWMANQTMERSLTWAGYEVDHAWGEGGHNGKHATQIFPDVMRWLWKDWQTNREIKVNVKGTSKWLGYGVLADGSEWEESTAIQRKSGEKMKALKLSVDGKVSKATAPRERTVLKSGVKIARLPETGQVTFNDATATTALSPDQTLFYVTEPAEAYVYSYQLGTDGSLKVPQPYFQLQAREAADVGAVYEARGMCVDTDGRLYVATALGVQVFDQAGRVNFIIPTPEQPLDVCFGGKDLGDLYITTGETVYVRPSKVHGVVSGEQAPVKPAGPRL